LNLPADRYPDGASRHIFYEAVSRQVSALPGVTDVGWTSFLPMTGGAMGIRYSSDESSIQEGDRPTYAEVRVFSPGFLRVLRIPMAEGAYPQGLTGEEEQEVVLVNRSLALSLWPQGETPVDKTVMLPFGSKTPARISGMVEDFAQSSVEKEVQPGIYVPWEIWSPAQMYLAVRTGGDPHDLVPGVRAAIWSLDQDMPINYVRTMEEVVNQTMADSRLTMTLLVAFGLLALTLGAVGVYGVAAYAVSQSTFEIGVRLALGAGKRTILMGTLQRYLAVSGIGIALGLVGALGASRILSGFLFQVSATDPMTFLGVGVFLALVALGAVMLPAYRASRVEPARVLKEE
jgi:predicted permease